ncbi:ATP-binding protein [Spirosoma rhododendri]|uniref:histidine kinase n=1 Tax=Spirosoma rhododendri TaxID=2728024 RepID=A0A7L5DV34_9BACT|nr:ATP-binding protein [Spirosoma rhododendri]QJD79420.1 PAS domain S-box protein [Spirosoma rhododendri]
MASSQPDGPPGQQTNDPQVTQSLLRATLDSSMDMIQVFEAVRDQQGQIVDFTWILNNHTAQTIYGDVVGKSLLLHQPGVVEEGIFDAFKHVVETGEPQQYEKQYVHEQFDGWFLQSVVRLNDGVATTTANITPRKRAQEQLQQNQALLQSVIDSSLDVIQVFKAVRDETGAIVDFIWVMNNHRAQVQNGPVIGKRLLELSPGVVPTGIFDHMVEVAQTGAAYEHEQFYDHEQFNGWFYQALVKTDDGVAMTTRDISRQKQAEGEVLRLKDEMARRATDKYRILFETIDEGFCVQELLFDRHGEVTDLIYREANQAFERHTGFVQVNGKRASEVFPHVEPGWFGALQRVHQTGVPERIEGFSTDTQRWLSAHYSPVGGAGSSFIAAVFQDVTERKQREQQQEYRLRLNDALRPLADPIAIQRVVMRLLGEHLGVDRAIYAEINLEEDWFDATDNYTSQSVQKVTGRFPFKAFGPPGELLKKGESLVIHDVSREVDEDSQKAFYAIDVLAVVAVPLIKNGTLVADLSVHQTTPRHWLDHEVDLLYETAERTWAAVERARAEAALRESEEALRASNDRLQKALSIDTVGVIFLNQHGVLQDVNSAFRHMSGLSPEDLVGGKVHWQDLTPPEFVAVSQHALAELWSNGQSTPYEKQYRRPDGSRWWGLFSGKRVSEDEIVEFVLDITQTKQAEQALQEADRRKDEFLAMLAHELRNPMSTLRSGLQILTRTTGIDQMSSEIVTMMSRQTDHLVRMVDDLLDVSRISRGKIVIHQEPVNLVDLVRQAQQSMRAQFEQQSRVLHVRLPDTPVMLAGDATRLTQVVVNLLTNGLRYSGEGGQVWLSLEHRGQEAIVQVRDNGIGLAQDKLSVIFELFVQVDNSVARSKGGLGLGLTLVKRLVELHGGRVEAQSGGIGQGSTFTVYLPTLTKAAEPTAQPAPRPGEPAAPQRILVIDDNADAGFTLAMLLKLNGYEAHSRTSGRSGIEAAQQLQPAAILLDIGMPELDGYATCRLIREQAWGQAMVVIAITGYGQEEDRQRTREAGFDGHLVKPVDLGALTILLTDLLDKGAGRTGLA